MPKCPLNAEQLVEYLDLELLAIPHITMTDVDLVTGELIVFLEGGKRYVMTIRESADDVG